MTEWSSERLSVLLGASAAIGWAVRVGLFELIAEEPRSIEALANELDCDPTALDAVVGVLEAKGLTQNQEGLVLLASSAGEALREAPGGLRHLAMWRSLDEWLRSGHSLLPPDGATRDRIYAHVVRALENRFAASAEALADSVGPARGPILDVGAGTGVWSLAMASLDPESTVTALDGKETCDIFLSRATERGLADRVDTLPGDYHELALPKASFARIVLGNVLHLESPDRAATLVSRLRPALRPGGSLVVVDAIRDGAPDRALELAVYRLHLTMRVEGSAVHERADFERWMRSAGLGEPTWNELPIGLWAISAEAP